MKQGRPLLEFWVPSPEEPIPVENPTGTSGRGLVGVVAMRDRALIRDFLAHAPAVIAIAWLTELPCRALGGGQPPEQR